MKIPSNINKRALGDVIFKRSGLYILYERRLESEIIKHPLPNHIAIILDGNRRWAKTNLIRESTGHFAGADKAEELLNWIRELKIRITTLYVLSTENLDRDADEIDNIYRLLQIKLERLYEDSRIHRLKMRIKAIGNLSILPTGLQEILCKLETVTMEYNSMFLNIAIAYGGQKEIVEAIKKIALNAKCGELEIEKIDEKLIESYLYTSHLPQPEPDLILRTSGEKRLSGFLIWQSAYSELVFMDVFWPEFRKIDLMRAIRTYQNRIRKYGR
jgi:tritrans,polycis-undecaprenyl-diphosphate synthase [geranylgeranyl-diphosphate specific]